MIFGIPNVLMDHKQNILEKKKMLIVLIQNKWLQKK